MITKEVKGKIETTTEPIWKYISPYLARCSFVTNWLKVELDSHVVKCAIGHKTEEAFEWYNKLSSEDAAKVILNAQKKVVTSDWSNDSSLFKLLLGSSEEKDLEYYVINREIDVNQYELTSEKMNFITRTAHTFEVGTSSLKLKKILNRLISLGIVVRLK